MDKYMAAVRAYLRLAEKTLDERYAYLEKQPVGEILRRNQATYTKALLGLVHAANELAAHDPLTWWENEEKPPF